MPFRPKQCLSVFATLLALGGCASQQSTDDLFGVITPYRIDIVQGTVVTSEQAALVRPGMSRTQVRDILGTPMLTDVFHADRWDYVFTFRRPGVESQRRAVIAHFKDDRLDRLEAPGLPSEREFIAAMAPGQRRSGAIPVLELTEEQRKALPLPARTETAPAPAAGAIRSYPPLEPS